VPETTPGDDAANLTALLYDYGGLWEIAKTRQGYMAKRRPLAAPPAVFTAETVGALRALLEHGYDTGKLAAIVADFGGQWQVEHLDPGSAWVAVSHGGHRTQIIAAEDLDRLRSTLIMASTDHTPAD
jgi:hypothetical protein